MTIIVNSINFIIIIIAEGTQNLSFVLPVRKYHTT